MWFIQLPALAAGASLQIVIPVSPVKLDNRRVPELSKSPKETRTIKKIKTLRSAWSYECLGVLRVYEGALCVWATGQAVPQLYVRHLLPVKLQGFRERALLAAAVKL